MIISQQDINQLSGIIDVQQPHGINIKSNNDLYRPLRNLFNIAQTSLRKLVQNPSLDEIEVLEKDNINNWTMLSDKLFIIFENTSRDLSMIGWFMCSQIILDPSFNGLKNTLTWLDTLIGDDWEKIPPFDNLDPSKDDNQQDSNDVKLQELQRFLGDSKESCLFYTPFLLLPLIPDVSLNQYYLNENKGKIAELKTKAKFISEKEKAYCQNKVQMLTDCITLLTHIQSQLEKIPHNTQKIKINCIFFISIINSYLSAMESILNIKVDNKVSLDKEVKEIEPELVSDNNKNDIVAIDKKYVESKLSQGQLFYLGENNKMNRNIAFHQIREISYYFKHSEPHSPVHYLLEKAIRWGQLTLSELWQEILTEKNDTLIDRIFNITGINEHSPVELSEITQPEWIKNGDINNAIYPTDLNNDKHALEQNARSRMNKNTQISESDNTDNATALRW